MTLRKKIYLIIASIAAINFLFIYAKAPLSTFPAKASVGPFEMPAENPVSVSAEGDLFKKNKLVLYESLHLGEQGLSRQAFEYAIKGYNYLLTAGKLENDGILSIVDFSLASCKKRLFILNMKQGSVLFNTYVAHGRGSGKEKASVFSNEPESNKSSLGFYVTGDTYIGKHGFSLRLFGEEKGINDNANSRAIVMHSAAYVSEEAIKIQGFIGRSLGCPALPEQLTKPIIETIKKGSCLFIYSPDNYYASHSCMLKKLI